MLVSVVLPVANQADHLATMVTSHRRRLGELEVDIELILVVNNSHDDTLAVARRLAEDDPAVRVAESKRGWGRAVRTGLGHARGDLVCYTNSARTTSDQLILVIRYGMVNDDVVIKASRKVRESLLRRLGSVIYNFEGRMLFGLAVWDVNGTPKVIPRGALERLDLREDGDLLDLELIVACKSAGVPIVEVPVYTTTRHGGRSTTRLQSAMVMYTGALRMALQRRALLRR